MVCGESSELRAGEAGPRWRRVRQRPCLGGEDCHSDLPAAAHAEEKVLPFISWTPEFEAGHLGQGSARPLGQSLVVCPFEDNSSGAHAARRRCLYGTAPAWVRRGRPEMNSTIVRRVDPTL